MKTSIPTSNSAISEFKAGLLEELPLQAGVLPFGMVYGILGIESGMSALETFMLSSLLFAGASQIIFTQLVSAATPALIIITSIAAINARHMLYATSMHRYIGHLPLGWRIVLAYLLTDEAYAVSIKRYVNAPHNPFMHYHLLGSGLLLFIVWQCSTLAGIVLGTAIPKELALGFAIPLSFMAIVIPLLTSKPQIITALSAAVIALSCQSLPWNSWLIVSAIGGIAAGMVADRWSGDRT